MGANEIKELTKDFVQYGLPILAFIGSIYSVFTSRKANKLQERILEIEKELKENELKRVKFEASELAKAKVEAKIVKISKGNYKLKIWNSGKATAYNVDIEEKEDVGMIYKSNTPFEFLESGKGFEELIIVSMGSVSKFTVITKWKDENDNDHSKENLVSI
jgi:hypothetical protein